MTAAREHRVIIVGSGIAGLSLALHLGSCTLVTKSRLGAGSSELAQGGLAAALGSDDSAASHAADTVAVAGGIADAQTVKLVTDSAAEGISWLEALGSRFDRNQDGLQLGREAGHSRHRIVHADGDATGREVMRALVEAVRSRDDIEVLEDTHAFDLIHDGGSVRGLVARTLSGDVQSMRAPAVVLATGGIGQVYARTTNPIEATGDGLAMAWRAGVRVRDAEFVQFHPTALDAGRDPLPLLTEALRGAGAVLRNTSGHRFMTDIHDDAELAPRDVVARANWHERSLGQVWLDARTIPDVAGRFPTAARLANEVGLDIVTDLLPITPAQHFHMGGIAVDGCGRTSLHGLFAVGEASSTGLHGANRLASNSLIEGLVFGQVIANAITAELHDTGERDGARQSTSCDIEERVVDEARQASLDREHGLELASSVRELMWNAGGIVRNESGLRTAIEQLGDGVENASTDTMMRNVVTVADLILRSALARRESRGAHFRSDHPAPRDDLAFSTSTRRSVVDTPA